MINSTGNIASMMAAQIARLRGNAATRVSSATTSFAQQMASANAALGRARPGTAATPAVAASQDSAVRQNSVSSAAVASTVSAARAAAATPATVPAADVAPPVTPPVVSLMPMTKPIDVRPPDLNAPSPWGPHGLDAATGKPAETESDAYWDSQPEPVQALRFIVDPGQRDALAKNLADQGYKIDVPIMVWNWDPQTTMMLRQQAGYTWVPSALMAPITGAPGVVFPGSQAYDPNHAPPGAIKVSLDFVKGTTGENPWLRS